MIFNILFFGFLSAVIGGLFTKTNPVTGKPENAVSRWISLSLVFIVLALQSSSIPLLLAWGVVFYVVRLIPTNTMLSAVNGNPPAREDSWKWQWMQDLAYWIRWHSPLPPSDYWLGIYYGAIRASLAIPAILYIGNPWLLLFLLQGAVYYAAGVFQRRFYPMKDYAPRIAEVISGALFGMFLALERIEGI